MKPKKKSLRCRGLGLDSGLDLAISRFIHSLVHNTVLDSEARYHGTAWYKRLGTIRGSGSATKWHGSPTLFKIILDQGSQSSKVPGSDQNMIHNKTGLDSEARYKGTVLYKIRRYALRYRVGYKYLYIGCECCSGFPISSSLCSMYIVIVIVMCVQQYQCVVDQQRISILSLQCSGSGS